MNIVLLGKSSSGKSSIQNELRKHRIFPIVRYTTRPIRNDEFDGIDYNFISISEMRDLIANGKMAEYVDYTESGKKDWIYATSKESLIHKESKTLILPPSSFRQLKTCKSVYISVDDRSRLIKQLERGDDIYETFRRSLSDFGQYDGIEREADLVIDNSFYNMSVSDIVKEILIQFKLRVEV